VSDHLTAREIVEGVPPELPVAWLLNALEACGFDRRVLDQATALEVDTDHLELEVRLLGEPRAPRLRIDVPLIRSDSDRLEAWLAARARNGSAS
jgi:hypothetical protein